ncbi:hypothetical protein SEUCBS140593_003735 [Sporothrix eucalyptigena]|uniref:Carboxylic ester hydrolase n=1 Tax=Sporothrix eucalyptigena TaxID=1812306 RepID=A0ABP0BHK6_9PEZI
MASLAHPVIGQVVGKESCDITQFLGIKYGRLKDRFAEAQLVSYSGKGLDATKYGPQVVSPPDGVDLELGFIQATLPKAEFPGTSDTEGLHLNISVPKQVESITGKEAFPVLVFIHGGGFAIGGNWWPQYNTAKLVKLSQEVGKPIIAVNINYRIGAPGFLTSAELRAAGYKPNNGLRDQRVALSWIKDYIKGFGGDPDNMTVAGESAGGVSTGYLLLDEKPVSRRLIFLGGTPPLMGQLPLPVADDVAQGVLATLGHAGIASEDVTKTLLSAPIEDFWTRIPPGFPIFPVIDGDIIPKEVTLASLADQSPSIFPGAKHVESILLVNSKLDASIMAYSGLLQRKKGIAAAFRTSLTKTLDGYPAATTAILEHYHLSENSTADQNDDEALRNVLLYINDVVFSVPAVELAAHFPQKSYFLAFNERNPWDGLFKGDASHILDIAFLFQNFNDQLSPEQQKAAVQFGTDVISFVSGDEVWPAFNKTKHAMAVYEKGVRKIVEPPSEEETSRNPFVFIITAGSNVPSKDLLYKAFGDFMAAH